MNLRPGWTEALLLGRTTYPTSLFTFVWKENRSLFPHQHVAWVHLRPGIDQKKKTGNKSNCINDIRVLQTCIFPIL